MVRGCLGARFSDEAEWRAFAQGCRTSSDRKELSRIWKRLLCLLEDLHLIQQLGDDDVPAADREQQRISKVPFANEITAIPQRGNTIGFASLPCSAACADELADVACAATIAGAAAMAGAAVLPAE